MNNNEVEIDPCSSITSAETPFPTPVMTPTPGKSFTFKCKRDFHTGQSGIEKMILSLGEKEECVLKLDKPRGRRTDRDINKFKDGIKPFN